MTLAIAIFSLSLSGLFVGEMSHMTQVAVPCASHCIIQAQAPLVVPVPAGLRSISTVATAVLLMFALLLAITTIRFKATVVFRPPQPLYRLLMRYKGYLA